MNKYIISSIVIDYFRETVTVHYSDRNTGYWQKKKTFIFEEVKPGKLLDIEHMENLINEYEQV